MKLFEATIKIAQKKMSIPSHGVLIPISFFVVLMASCRSIEEKREVTIAKHIDYFKENEGSWDALAKRLIKKFDPNNTSGIKAVKEIEQPLRKELEDKGIEGIWPRLVGKCKEVEIYTDWAKTPEGRIRLTWTSCLPQESVTTFYNHWDTGIRIEKITDNWYLWMVY